jgi:hypothetical protein
MSSLLEGIDISEKTKPKSSSGVEDAARSQRTKLIAALVVMTLAIGVIIWQVVGLSNANRMDGATQTEKSMQQAAEIQKSVEEAQGGRFAPGQMPAVLAAPSGGSQELRPR